MSYIQSDTYYRPYSLILESWSWSPILDLLKAVLYKIEKVFINVLHIFRKLSSCRSQQYLTREKKFSLGGLPPNLNLTFFSKIISFFEISFFAWRNVYLTKNKKHRQSSNLCMYQISAKSDNIWKSYGSLIFSAKKRKKQFFSYKGKKKWYLMIVFKYNKLNLLVSISSQRFIPIMAWVRNLEQI